MEPLEALLLGIVQGLTEFLPVSSSAHLAIFKKILHISSSEETLYFDLICHLGTLAALLIVLWKDAIRVLMNKRSIKLFFLALLPLVPAYLLLKPLRVALADQTGWFLLGTSCLLFFSSWKQRTTTKLIALETPFPVKEWKWTDVLLIGAMQTLALFPGISRSGSTIATARWLGWEWREAARFSFLLAIPTILGGTLLETAKNFHQIQHLSMSIYLVGFFSSMIVGLGALRLLFWILDRGTLRPFAVYCLIIGLVTLFVVK